ncbi:MAG: immunity 53 family protein [Sphingobium sp.]|nr:immunity 53 family protein [Sphingobium sp.]
MEQADDIGWLMGWYLSHCDGDWEHEYGVTIDTPDNPGWSLTVDLDGTPLEQRPFVPIFDGVTDEEPVQGGDGDTRWMVCRIEGAKFKAYGGPRDLGRMIGTFRAWAQRLTN